jgi:hypothetical protein
MTIRQQRRRRRRLDALVEEHGKIEHCDLAVDDRLPRWVLLEAYVGPGTKKKPWWTLGSDWRELVRESADQLHASDWPATLLFDLDSDFSTGIGPDNCPAIDPGQARAGLRLAGAMAAPRFGITRWAPRPRELGSRLAARRRVRPPRVGSGEASTYGRDHDPAPRAERTSPGAATKR